jgi:hypothetical protein
MRREQRSGLLVRRARAVSCAPRRSAAFASETRAATRRSRAAPPSGQRVGGRDGPLGLHDRLLVAPAEQGQVARRLDRAQAVDRMPRDRRRSLEELAGLDRVRDDARLREVEAREPRSRASSRASLRHSASLLAKSFARACASQPSGSTQQAPSASPTRPPANGSATTGQREERHGEVEIAVGHGDRGGRETRC